MVKRELIIKTADALGNNYDQNITYVNPDATNAQIDTFARTLTGLSNRTYLDTIRVEKESVTEALAEEG